MKARDHSPSLPYLIHQCRNWKTNSPTCFLARQRSHRSLSYIYPHECVLSPHLPSVRHERKAETIARERGGGGGARERQRGEERESERRAAEQRHGGDSAKAKLSLLSNLAYYIPTQVHTLHMPVYVCIPGFFFFLSFFLSRCPAQA